MHQVLLGNNDRAGLPGSRRQSLRIERANRRHVEDTRLDSVRSQEIGGGQGALNHETVGDERDVATVEARLSVLGSWTQMVRDGDQSSLGTLARSVNPSRLSDTFAAFAAFSRAWERVTPSAAQSGSTGTRATYEPSA